MNTLDQMAETGHERVSFHQDPSGGLQSIVAVHSTARGPAFGAVRRRYYATEADAVHDALRLSEAMTWKAAAADLGLGGGKIIVILPHPRQEPEEAEARAIGRIIESCRGSLISAGGPGIGRRYVRWMAAETARVIGSDDQDHQGGPAPFTARGVINAMIAALAGAGRRADLAGLDVAIQGVGKVGASLARMLTQLGAKVRIADINDDAVKRIADECGAEPVACESILTGRCDILAPCAMGRVIDAGLVRKLRCAIICGAANNMLDDRDEDSVALKARDIVYVPDFIANAGGLIELGGAYLGLAEPDRRRRIDGIEQTTLRVLRDAESAASTHAAAVALARERIARAGKINAHAG
jgi:leucine dehydrogenase